MTTNNASLGWKTDNPFHYQKFILEIITVYWNGYVIATTSLKAINGRKLYLNTLGALAFESHGHGVPFADLSNPYFYLELTNDSISCDLRFSVELTDSLEQFFSGHKVFNGLDRFVTQINEKYLSQYEDR